MGASVTLLHAKQPTSKNKQHAQLTRSCNSLAQNVKQQQQQQPIQLGGPGELNDPSDPSGILHLAIERQVAPIQGHDGGNILVLHKVGILAKLVFADDEKENKVQVDKLRAALGVLHSGDSCVYVVHDYNARGIPGTRGVKLLFASKNVLRSSMDV